MPSFSDRVPRLAQAVAGSAMIAAGVACLFAPEVRVLVVTLPLGISMPAPIAAMAFGVLLFLPVSMHWRFNHNKQHRTVNVVGISPIGSDWKKDLISDDEEPPHAIEPEQLSESGSRASNETEYSSLAQPRRLNR